jgi:hypothetical protein
VWPARLAKHQIGALSRFHGSTRTALPQFVMIDRGLDTMLAREHPFCAM